MKQKTKLYLVIVYLILGLIVNVFSSNLISFINFNPPILDDLILNTIDGNYSWSMKLAEIIIGFSIILFVLYAKKNKEDVIKWIFIIATFQLIRGIMIPLTIYNPIVSSSFFSRYVTFRQGVMPSGHVSIPFLFYLFTYKKSKLQIFFLISTFLVSLFLLLSKNHYTIDLIVAFFVCYSIKCFTEKHIFKEKC